MLRRLASFALTLCLAVPVGAAQVCFDIADTDMTLVTAHVGRLDNVQNPTPAIGEAWLKARLMEHIQTVRSSQGEMELGEVGTLFLNADQATRTKMLDAVKALKDKK